MCDFILRHFLRNSMPSNSLNMKNIEDHFTVAPPATIPRTSILTCEPLKINAEGDFVDLINRRIRLKGMNMDGSLKFPAEPFTTSRTGDPTDRNSVFFEGDKVSFVGRPYPLEEAREHFTRIKSWGYNLVRYVITWEAIEHAGPDQYDEEFIDYTVKMLKIIHDVGGLYVMLEMHQDVWSRYTGGSGAPMWTLYAAGLDPRNFAATQAATLHNEPRFRKPNPTDTYYNQMWATNYKRLASIFMFTLFFTGKTYFPSLVINDVHIQDYLQSHYSNSAKTLWAAVAQQAPEVISGGTVLGFESLNEPNIGLFGFVDITKYSADHQLRLGTTPTIFESLKLGMGFPCKIDEYRLSIIGPRKYNTKVVDPRGVRCWLSKEEALIADARYGWQRGSSWPIGECPFASAGIWHYDDALVSNEFLKQAIDVRLKSVNKGCAALKADYFYQETRRRFPDDKVDVHLFMNTYFVESFVQFKKAIRDIVPDLFVFMQTPVVEGPPQLKDDTSGILDSKTVVTPHFYDSLSLLFKTWNYFYNIDSFGIVRGRYWNPIFGIVFGERAIRNNFVRQFKELTDEIRDKMGPVPILMSETGMPFDMNNKEAYRTRNYKSQTDALDALYFALEETGLSHAFWGYTSTNSHENGDNWNNEDFLFWSKDDLASKALALTPVATSNSKNSSATAIDPESIPYDGLRAIDAVVRPYTIVTIGNIQAEKYDARKLKYEVTMTISDQSFESPTTPTIIFVPKAHFPTVDVENLYFNSGNVRYHSDLEFIAWYHTDHGKTGNDPGVPRQYKLRIQGRPTAQ